MTNFRRLALTALPAFALAAPMFTPSIADACGGTFCDAGPTAMPVDQSGENILFKIDDTSVEAHIQIQIDPNTDAEQFAWVIPVTALPEFEVGSQLFFDRLLQGSVPIYGRTFTSDQCGGNGLNDGAASSGFTTGGGDEGWGETGGDGDPGGPDIVYQDNVGAFEIAVLDGGTVEGVMQWLGDNGYQQDPASEPILAEYLAEDFLFVALKLGVEVGVDEVHPIVIRYEGDEPCVPIRLTRIAAVDDMDIRTFFLGQNRVVPINYRHVLVNPLKIDWINDGANYKEVISLAVDAPEADGNAFVTEYAGASDVVNTNGLFNSNWDRANYSAFPDSPVGVIERLMQDDLLFCDFDFDQQCIGLHPLVDPIVAQFIPVPEGLNQAEFYSCLECYVDQIDLAAWDANAMATMLDERVFQPAFRATKLIDNNPYLTRMYTTISPNEMMADPIFQENSRLSDVESFRQAEQRTLCNDSRIITLPDGRQVYFPGDEPFEWPDFATEMPYEEEVEQGGMADDAPLINLVDNTNQINDLLDAYNRSKGFGKGGIGGCSVEDPAFDPAGAAGSALFGLMALGLFGLVRRKND